MTVVLTAPVPAETARPPRQRDLGLLIGAAFAGPWAVWGSAIAQAHGWTTWRLPQGLALWTMPVLLLAAFLATGGTAAARSLCARMLRVRGCGRWAVVGLATPIALAASAAGLAALLGAGTEVGHVLGLPAALVYLVYGVGLFLLTEEAVWRGALLPWLQTRLRPLPANLVLGGIWALWHVPLLAVPGAGDEGLPLVPFAILVVGTSVLIGALVNAARGSVVVAAVFHAAFDAAYSYAGVVGTDHTALWAAAALTTVAATAVVVRTRGLLGLLAD